MAVPALSPRTRNQHVALSSDRRALALHPPGRPAGQSTFQCLLMGDGYTSNKWAYADTRASETLAAHSGLWTVLGPDFCPSSSLPRRKTDPVPGSDLPFVPSNSMPTMTLFGG